MTSSTTGRPARRAASFIERIPDRPLARAIPTYRPIPLAASGTEPPAGSRTGPLDEVDVGVVGVRRPATLPSVSRRYGALLSCIARKGNVVSAGVAEQLERTAS
jgi:hypothetical protein